MCSLVLLQPAVKDEGLKGHQGENLVTYTDITDPEVVVHGEFEDSKQVCTQVKGFWN